MTSDWSHVNFLLCRPGTSASSVVLYMLLNKGMSGYSAYWLLMPISWSLIVEVLLMLDQIYYWVAGSTNCHDVKTRQQPNNHKLYKCNK